MLKKRVKKADFNFNGLSRDDIKNLEMDIGRYNQENIRSLYPILKDGVYHRCSLDSYRSIYKDQYIKPNDGSFKFTYPQSQGNYGYKNGWVCLLDFRTDLIKLVRTVWNWAQFFRDQKPLTLVFELEREKLPKLIPSNAVPKVGQEGYLNHIGYVEAWYPEPIPTSAIKKYLITVNGNPVKYLVFEAEQLELFHENLDSLEIE